MQEDAGAPLVCTTLEHGTVMVGLFQHLGGVVDGNRTKEEEEVEQRPNRAACAGAYEMNFSLINEDEELQKLIEEQDLGPFVNVYDRCEFV